MQPQLKEMVSDVSDLFPQIDISLQFQSYAPFYKVYPEKNGINNPVNSDFVVL